MTWFFGVLLVLLIGGIAVVAAGQGEALAPAETDEPRPRLPDHPLTPADLRGVRFSTALRGYRAEEVDALLARLAAEMDAEMDAGMDAGMDAELEAGTDARHDRDGGAGPPA